MAQPYSPYAPATSASNTTDPQLQLPQIAAMTQNSLYPSPNFHDVHAAPQEPYRPPPPMPQMLEHPQDMQHDMNNGFSHDLKQLQNGQGSQDPQQSQTPGSKSKENSARGNNRLRKACDSCSIRKVKCDEAGPPCRACAALDIPCTYERPSRRRGPPNRHAEAIKRQRLESSHQGSPMMSAPASPAYPLVNLSPTSAPSGLNATSIAPLELINLFIDDYFTYAHPLTPFPHEPSFREAWRRRKDVDDRFFLALLAGMIGNLVSMFPRRPRRHLKALNKEHLFPSSSALIDVCRAVCLEARGAGYLEREGLYVYDAATSYFLLSMSSFMYRWQAADMYLGECFTIIRASGFYKPRPPYPPSTIGARSALMDDHSLNIIDEEIGRRIFWTVFVTARSARAFGASLGDLPIRPPTPSQGYPALPMEIDDKFIHQNHYERQPQDVVSRLAGFNANIQIYLTHNPLVAMESSYGIDMVFDWEKQKRVLKQCQEKVKHILDDAPEALLVWPAPSRSPSSTASHARIENHYLTNDAKIDTHFFNHAQAQPQMTYQTMQRTSEEESRQIAYEMQKANIHVSVLSSRSFFLEKYWGLCQQFAAPAAESGSVQDAAALAYRIAIAANGARSHCTAEEIEEVREEREHIARDLLDVLSKIRPIHMEPNSVSFCMKIRQIASTLLPTAEGDASRLHDDGLAAKYLRPVLEILMDVEKSGQAHADEDDEEADIRRWTGLRDYQKELFARKKDTEILG